MKKQRRKRKVRVINNTSKGSSYSTMDSSKNSSSSIPHDWENWVHLHGKMESVAEDVKSLGKVVGVKYQCATLNRFNMLLKEGRR